MLEQYRTVYEGGEGEITEKKSRFIATVHPVESEEEALAFLEEMKKQGITDCAVVVTRYFGGVLLGTGGLVRAYSKAVQEGLAASKVILKQKGIALKITTDYTGLGKIQYIAGERNIPVLDSEYTDKVVMKLLVPVQDVGSVQKAITEGTNGRAGIEKDQELYYAVIDGKVITFDH